MMEDFELYFFFKSVLFLKNTYIRISNQNFSILKTLFFQKLHCKYDDGLKFFFTDIKELKNGRIILDTDRGLFCIHKMLTL